MAGPGNTNFSLMSKLLTLPGSTRLSPKSAAPRATFASLAATSPLPVNRSLVRLASKRNGRRFRRPIFAYLVMSFRLLLHSLAVAAFRIAHPSGHAILHTPQTPSQPLGQLMPRAPQPRL